MPECWHRMPKLMILLKDPVISCTACILFSPQIMHIRHARPQDAMDEELLLSNIRKFRGSLEVDEIADGISSVLSSVSQRGGLLNNDRARVRLYNWFCYISWDHSIVRLACSAIMWKIRVKKNLLNVLLLQFGHKVPSLLWHFTCLEILEFIWESPKFYKQLLYSVYTWFLLRVYIMQFP